MYAILKPLSITTVYLKTMMVVGRSFSNTVLFQNFEYSIIMRLISLLSVLLVCLATLALGQRGGGGGGGGRGPGGGRGGDRLSNFALFLECYSMF